METHICLCALCAGRGLTCCQGADRDIFVTAGDVRRISGITGHLDFFEFRRPVNTAYCGDDADPVWSLKVFRPDGTRRVLKKNPSGDCIFLTPNGCVLPLHLRPLICRLHPVDYTAEKILPELAPGCPVDLLEPGANLLQSIGIDPQEVIGWHRALYAEITSENTL